MDNISTPYMPQFDFDNGIFKYWGDGETLLELTTTDDTAKYVAEAVSDPNLVNTALEVASEVLSTKQLYPPIKRLQAKAARKAIR
jgi:nucleoside-diphosphate-sugar epimerase